MIPWFCDSVIPWLRDFSFFLSNTFAYEPILLKLSMNANIVKMQIFQKIKSDLRGHSRSQIITFLIKNSPFLLFMLLMDWRNKCRWSLWNNKVWLIKRRHLSCFYLNLRSDGQLFVLVSLCLYKRYSTPEELWGVYLFLWLAEIPTLHHDWLKP